MKKTASESVNSIGIPGIDSAAGEPEFMRIWNFKRKIGVIGLYKSGKTVFLTSLINHLKNHRPQLMGLGDGTLRLSPAEDLPVAGGLKTFPYEAHRRSLVEQHAWPRKTEFCHQARYQFTRSDWSMTMLDMSFLDMPGERLADITMAGRSYDEWSSAILNVYENHPEYREACADYFALLERARKGTLNGSELLKCYRESQARLIMGFRPVVSPSSFLLDAEGGYASQRDASGLVDHRFCGLGPDQQFAPLSLGARSAHTELAQAMQKHYQLYRKQVVDPLAAEMARCQTLVVLVDITTLLAGGLGMYHGNRELLKQLVAYLEPGDSTGSYVARKAADWMSLGNWQWSGVRRIAFCATKADKVHESERHKLRGLLKEMAAPLVEALQARKKLTVEYFVTAAAQSTESIPGGKLEAFLPGQDDSPRSFTPSRVPDDWPAQWEIGSYRYPDVSPWMPPRQDLPPRQIEMNLVLEFLMESMDQLR